ncbi:MAG: sigma 54-interacting transcriptional regulator [Bacteroidales bacterium]|nr:sigma 54-interacting transcriptional regulator [Bacteroidales bacterium]
MEIKNIKVDVRLIAATNRNLEAMIQHGTFREDLFYRLNGTRIIISPLRKRPDDIEPIANHIWKKLNGRNRLSKAFIKGLQKQTWPGNVRELKATLNSIMDFFGTGDAKPHYLTVLQKQKLEDVKLLSEYEKDEKTDFLKAESQRRMIEIQILINQIRIECTNHSEPEQQSAAYPD